MKLTDNYNLIVAKTEYYENIQDSLFKQRQELLVKLRTERDGKTICDTLDGLEDCDKALAKNYKKLLYWCRRLKTSQ